MRDGTDEVCNTEDILDTRTIMARVEYLEAARETFAKAYDDETGHAEWQSQHDDDARELEQLCALLDDLKGNGGDEQWRGAWYPITLVRDTYFEDYARDLASDMGAIKEDTRWPANHIDWPAAAEELKNDYQQFAFDGVTYWAH